MSDYPMSRMKMRATFASLKEQANEPVEELVKRHLAEVGPDALHDEEAVWVRKHHGDLQQYRDIDVEEMVEAAVRDMEVMRVESYPEHSPDSWDAVQACELFSDDGEPSGALTDEEIAECRADVLPTENAAGGPS